MVAFLILVTDDNYANRLIAKTLLEREGFSIYLVESGQRAITLCETIKFQAILMDIQMPSLDGIMTFKRIRSSDGPNKDSLIFAFTAYHTKEDITFYYDTGFNSVLTKPLILGDVLHALDRHQTREHIAPNTASRPAHFANLSWQQKSMRGNDEALPPPESDLLNQVMIDNLKSAGSADALTRLLYNFWQEHSQNMLSIGKDMERLGHIGTIDHIRKTIHMIKGSAANIGALRLSRYVAHMQNAPPSHLADLYGSLETCTHETYQALYEAFSLPPRGNSVALCR